LLCFVVGNNLPFKQFEGLSSQKVDLSPVEAKLAQNLKEVLIY
jgi:hypothetical protein